MSNINPVHDRLLARPMKHKVKPRFNPFELCKRFIRSVVPLDNQRLAMLSWQTKPIVKYTPPDIPSPSDRWMLKERFTPRLVSVLKPFVRRLTTQKKGKKNLGLTFLINITDRISISLDHIFLYNVYLFMAEATVTPAANEIKYFFPDGDRKRLKFLAKPKKTHRPPKLPPRKKKVLSELAYYVGKLARPKWVFKPESQDSLVKKMGISQAARNCVPNVRTIELARNVPWKMVEPSFYYTVTPRLNYLSVAKAKGKDYSRNPHYITPDALKYQATPRILELAKPKGGVKKKT